MAIDAPPVADDHLDAPPAGGDHGRGGEDLKGFVGWILFLVLAVVFGIIALTFNDDGDGPSAPTTTAAATATIRDAELRPVVEAVLADQGVEGLQSRVMAGTVTLTGEMPDLGAIDALVAAVEELDGVTEVDSQLTLPEG